MNLNLMPLAELTEINVQTPLSNTKPATEIVSQLKEPSAPQALEAIPFLILKEVIHRGYGTEAPQHGTILIYLPSLQAAPKWALDILRAFEGLRGCDTYAVYDIPKLSCRSSLFVTQTDLRFNHWRVQPLATPS